MRLHFRCRHTFASLWGACLRFVSLWLANSRGDSCVFGVHLSKVCWGLIFCLRKAFIDLCLLNRPKPPSFRSLLLNFTLIISFHIFSMVRHCLWKMSAPGACIKPGLVRRPLCHKVNLPSCVARQPLCHKVNLPRCEARQRHHDLWYFRHRTNELFTSMYLLGKTYKPARSSATRESLKSTRSTKLLEKSLTWAAHAFHWMFSQG